VSVNSQVKKLLRLPSELDGAYPREQWGTQRAPAMTNMNLRGSKEFKVGAQRIGFDVDVFSLLNRATPSNVTRVSGPTFGYATEVLPARVVRIFGRFSF
jgi:hypothetical protein